MAINVGKLTVEDLRRLSSQVMNDRISLTIVNEKYYYFKWEALAGFTALIDFLNIEEDSYNPTALKQAFIDVDKKILIWVDHSKYSMPLEYTNLSATITSITKKQIIELESVEMTVYFRSVHASNSINIILLTEKAKASFTYCKYRIEAHVLKKWYENDKIKVEKASKAATLFQILKISESATDREVTKAWRKEVMIWHPDKHQGDEAQFLRIQQAHDILSNTIKRKRYIVSQKLILASKKPRYQRPTYDSWDYPKLNHNIQSQWGETEQLLHLGKQNSQVFNNDCITNGKMTFKGKKMLNGRIKIEEILEWDGLTKMTGERLYTFINGNTISVKGVL